MYVGGGGGEKGTEERDDEGVESGQAKIQRNPS